MKIGYCCINQTLKIGTKSITLKKYNSLDKDEQYNKLQTITRTNFDNLLTVLKWNVQNNIKMFRVGSDIVPLATISNIEYDFTADNYIIDICTKIRKLCAENDIRLTIHPSQFVVLNSFNEDVFNNSIKDLEYHANICKLLDIKSINIHVGGVYNDKISAMKNFIDNFRKVPSHIQSLICLENDDKSYNVSETLFLCETCNIPMILDLHHDRVLHSVNNVEFYLDRIIKSWENRNIKPLAHISSSADNNKIISKHHDYILLEDYEYFTNILNNDFDIEFECKQKELGIFNIINNSNN